MNEIESLAIKAAEGDNNAFDKLYSLTVRTVYFTCLSFMKNEADAKDALQEAYLAAFRNISSLKEPDKFQSWLNRIAVNTCKNLLKAKAPEPLEEEIIGELAVTEDENFLPEDYITNQEKRRIVLEIMRNKLSDTLYQTVVLYYFDEMTVSEIAEIMECPTGTVTYRLSVSRTKIKEGVLEYENKNDDKLHAVVGIPFLTKLLRAEADSLEIPQFTPDFSSAVKSSVNNAAKSAEKGVTSMSKSLTVKLIAGIAAVAVIGGGIAAGVALSGGDDDDTEPSIVYDNGSDNKKNDKPTVSDSSENDSSENDSSENDSSEADSSEEDSSEKDNSGASGSTSEYPEFDGLERVEFKRSDGNNGSLEDIISGHIKSAYHKNDYNDNFWVFLDDNGNIYEYKKSIYYNVEELASNTGMTNIENMFWGGHDYESGLGDYSYCLTIVQDSNVYMKLFENKTTGESKELRTVFGGNEGVKQLQASAYLGRGVDFVDADGLYHEPLFDDEFSGGQDVYFDSEKLFYEASLCDGVPTKKLAGNFRLTEDGTVLYKNREREYLDFKAKDIFLPSPSVDFSTIYALTEDGKLAKADANREKVTLTLENVPEGVENIWANGANSIILKAADGYYSCNTEDGAFEKLEALDNVSDMIVYISNGYVLLSNGYIYELAE